MEKTTFSFKKLFRAAIFGFIPIMLIVGVCAYLGYDVFRLNDNYIHGLKGFFISILFTPIYALLLSAFAWLFFNFGGFLFDYFSKVFKFRKAE